MNNISWESCVSHSGACAAGFVIAVLVLIIIIVVAMYWGYGISRPAPVVIAPVTPAAATAAVTAASAAPAPVATAAPTKECFATPYDLDPATAELLKYRMKSDPLVSRRGKERMTGSENPNLLAALGGGAARI